MLEPGLRAKLQISLVCAKAELGAGSTGRVRVQTGRHINQCSGWPVCSCPASAVGTVVSPLLTVLVVHDVRSAVAMLGVHRFGVQMRESTLSLVSLAQ